MTVTETDDWTSIQYINESKTYYFSILVFYLFFKETFIMLIIYVLIIICFADTPFFEANKRYNTIKRIYQNSFCYHCNNEIGLSSVDVCLNDAIDGNRDIVPKVSFTAFMDLSLTLSNLEKQNEVTGMCAIIEIYSEIDVSFRKKYSVISHLVYLV